MTNKHRNRQLMDIYVSTQALPDCSSRTKQTRKVYAAKRIAGPYVNRHSLLVGKATRKALPVCAAAVTAHSAHCHQVRYYSAAQLPWQLLWLAFPAPQPLPPAWAQRHQATAATPNDCCVYASTSPSNCAESSMPNIGLEILVNCL